MPLWTYFEKPDFSTDTWYRPTGNAVAVKAPLLPVCVSLIKPVSRFWIVTLASATLSPDGSDTVPFSVAVVYWAKTAEDAIRAKKIANRHRLQRTDRTQEIDTNASLGIRRNPISTTNSFAGGQEPAQRYAVNSKSPLL